jgi:glycerophosphoryl diester phosphodiesterase
VIAGGSGDDILFGGKGNDVIWGDDNTRKSRDSAAGGNDVLVGGAGDDLLGGKSGDDWLVGGSGSDILKGNSGNDVLDGGRHRDALIGGTGSDVFVLMLGSEADRIRDFEMGVDFIGLADGLQYEDLTFTKRGIFVGSQQLAILKGGVDATTLTAADFISI